MSRLVGTLFVNGSALAPLIVSPAMTHLQLEGCRDLKDADLAAAMQHLDQVPYANSELKLIFFNGTRPLFSCPQSTDPYSVEG